jgi:hypothetical protein
VPNGFELKLLQRNVKCLNFLKETVEHQQKNPLAYVATFFLFLRFLCEGWSFITLVLWFRGIYTTPQFGVIWVSSIVRHSLLSVFAALLFYHALWPIAPSLIVSSISFVFIYIIWPLGSILLAHSLLTHGLKAAAVAATHSYSPRSKSICRSPALQFTNVPRDADKRTDSMPKERSGVISRARSPIAMH